MIVAPRSFKPPVPEEAKSPPRSPNRSPEPLRSARSYTSSANGDVRPQWTPHTTAGRAKLHVDGENWEWAERARRLRVDRERYRHHWTQQLSQRNSYEAAARREDNLRAIAHMKAQHKQALDRKGIAGKRESDDMRRRAREQKEAWEHYGRLLHTVHNNDGCRRQKALLHNQRAQEYVQSRRVSERIVREREAEEAHRAVYVKERAEAIRQDNVRAVKSVSASELKIRQKAADAMRQEEVRRSGYRHYNRQLDIAEQRRTRDAVDNSASIAVVAEANAAERRRKKVIAAQVREQIQAMRHSRMYTERSEVERKRAMHDAVRRAAIDGPEGGHTYGQYSRMLNSPRDSELGFSLSGVRRTGGGGTANYGYSSDDGRPPQGKDHYSPERDGFLFENFARRGQGQQSPPRAMVEEYHPGYESA